MYEDGDSLHSDDSGGRHDDSDEFADDEGMSNADSSSQVRVFNCSALITHKFICSYSHLTFGVAECCIEVRRLEYLQALQDIRKCI